MTDPRGRVLLITRDLMFGSKVEAMILAAGFEAVISESVPGDGSADALWIVDLAQGDFDPAEVADHGAPVLAYYAHTDDDVRRAAIAAGLEKVVPRSRMLREGAVLIQTHSRSDPRPHSR